MYAAGTILTLKDPKDPDPETGEVHAYNQIKFVTGSPVPPNELNGWTGEDAKYAVYVPIANFAGNLHEQYGVIRELYDVTFIPEAPGEVEEPIKSEEQQRAERAAAQAAKAAASRTPEDVFAVQAPGKPSEAGERVRSPLDPVVAPSKRGPLPKVQSPAAKAKAAAKLVS